LVDGDGRKRAADRASGLVSAELAHRGIAAETRVHVLVEFDAGELSMAASPRLVEPSTGWQTNPSFIPTLTQRREQTECSRLAASCSPAFHHRPV
jgi:hypothetical protein